MTKLNVSNDFRTGLDPYRPSYVDRLAAVKESTQSSTTPVARPAAACPRKVYFGKKGLSATK